MHYIIVNSNKIVLIHFKYLGNQSGSQTYSFKAKATLNDFSPENDFLPDATYKNKIIVFNDLEQEGDDFVYGTFIVLPID